MQRSQQHSIAIVGSHKTGGYCWQTPIGTKYPLNLVRKGIGSRASDRLKSVDVIEMLAELFMLRGVPRYIRSDNGPEFIAEAVQGWIVALGARTAYITPGSPWENGCVESHCTRQKSLSS